MRLGVRDTDAWRLDSTRPGRLSECYKDRQDIVMARSFVKMTLGATILSCTAMFAALDSREGVTTIFGYFWDGYTYIYIYIYMYSSNRYVFPLWRGPTQFCLVSQMFNFGRKHSTLSLSLSRARSLE